MLAAQGARRMGCAVHWPVVVVVASSSCAPCYSLRWLARAGGMPLGSLPRKWKWDVAVLPMWAGLILLLPCFPACSCREWSWKKGWEWQSGADVPLRGGSESWGQHAALGSALSRYKSMGLSRQGGGSSLGHHVLPAGPGMGPWDCIHRCHRSTRLNHLSFPQLPPPSACPTF